MGGSPVSGLLFLRTGDVYVPPPADLARALAATRDRIDYGGLLDAPPLSMFDGTQAQNRDA